MQNKSTTLTHKHTEWDRLKGMWKKRFSSLMRWLINKPSCSLHPLIPHRLCIPSDSTTTQTQTRHLLCPWLIIIFVVWNCWWWCGIGVWWCLGLVAWCWMVTTSPVSMSIPFPLRPAVYSSFTNLLGPWSVRPDRSENGFFFIGTQDYRLSSS